MTRVFAPAAETARIDFAQPLDAAAPRLRCAFGAPRQVLLAQQVDEVRAVLDAVHAAAQRGHWCVGYVRYEAAPAFDTALQTHCRGAAGGGARCVAKLP